MARGNNERGAVMVEMAIVVPVFLLLVFGMLEFGLAFKDKLTMEHAVNAGTRRATVMGNDAYADIEILEAFRDGLVGAASTDVIVHVDIFKVDSNGDKDVYNRYTVDPDGTPCFWDPCPDPVAMDPAPPVYGNPDDYLPCDRDIALSPSDGVDTIGVEVEYTHSWVTGVLGFSEATWTETAFGRMEPDLFGADEPSC